MIASVSGPASTTETDYTYHPVETKKGVSLTTTQTKSWAKLSEAKNYKAGVISIYYNPDKPSEVRFEPAGPNWVRVSANPVSTRIRITGEGTATLRIGSPLFPKIATTTGPQVADYTVGQSITVWLNPISQTELSFQPRATIGGQKYWMLALAGIGALTGIGALIVGKKWMKPVQPLQPAYQNFPGRPTPVASITEQPNAIDWFQFESVAARILEFEGWTVQKLGGSKPDGGADLLAIRNGRKAVVQCKHWRRVEVQPKIIRELLGTKSSAQFTADDAILFTLSNCTSAAMTCAKENNVAIFNASAVEAVVRRLGLGRFPELTNPENKHCPKCGATMVLRANVENPFWGCSTYPRCRGVIERA